MKNLDIYESKPILEKPSILISPENEYSLKKLNEKSPENKNNIFRFKSRFEQRTAIIERKQSLHNFIVNNRSRSIT